MESSAAGINLSSIREKVMEELVEGHACATQLQIHLDFTGSAHLVTKILSSLTKALSILTTSTESGKIPVSSSCQDQRRKRFKGRKTQETFCKKMQETFCKKMQETRITAMPIEDGYAWRKYGQKDILNAKQPRCYYRCSFKFNKGCQATKQVQRTKDEPPMFWTKYTGHHTCQDVLKIPLFMDSTAEEGLLLNFESSTWTKQDPPFFSSFSSSKEEHIQSFPSIKQDYNPSSSEYLPPQDPTEFKSGIPTSALPLTTLQSGHGDVVLGCNTSSSGSLDMPMELMDFVFLDDVYWFSDHELF